MVSFSSSFFQIFTEVIEKARIVFKYNRECSLKIISRSNAHCHRGTANRVVDKNILDISLDI